ncbi:MAG: methylmalonyl-CoA mutase small subunit [Hyphomicrobiales bacterium]|nr:methylmalonyl-CoA mutase small subunit [Hyphomicrobiales bacterium]
MTEQQLNFTEGFTPPSYEEWKGEVEKALKGAPFDKKMLNKSYEGITLRPIYTRQDWPADGDPSGFPGSAPFTRGSTAAGNRMDSWDVRQAYDHPDPAKGNEIILNELNRGVNSVIVVFDQAACAGLDGDQSGAADLAGLDGVMIYSADDLDRLLTGVYLDLAPIVLKPGAQFMAAAGMLSALWHRRRIEPAQAQGCFGADPIGTLAGTGTLPVSVDTALEHLADLAKHTAATYPQVRAVEVDTSAYHDAGASEAQDLAASMATAVAYLKAMTAAGLDIDRACQQIQFTYSLDCDQFLSIAKLRAARKMWARVTESCGASEPARAMKQHAITARRIMTQRDPWVNVLRATVTCFAGAVGGADSVTVLPLDDAIGLAGDVARRVARNTHVVLAEESNLDKVIDPAGGSWYVETRTDDLAKAAWQEFQAIEGAGGMVAVLSDGSFKAKIAESYAAREKNLAKRKEPLTGVNEFPNIAEGMPKADAPDLAAARAAAGERLKATRGSAQSSALDALKAASAGGVSAATVAAAEGGATIGAMAQALGGETTTIDALPSHRFAERFEALRDASDAYKAKTGHYPQIFLANLGPIAKHTARATFAKNFFEVGGIEALTNTGFKDAESCAAAFKDSGAAVAIVCSADPIYEEMIPSVAPALKAAGCKRLFLAGAPGDKKDTYTQAGVDDFVFLGGDVLETTRSTLALLGVIDQ